MITLLKSLLKPGPRLALILLLTTAFIAYYFGGSKVFEDIVAFLDSDSASLTIGVTRISLWLVIKAVLAAAALLWTAAFVSAFGERRISNLTSVRASNRVLATKAFQIIVYFFAFVFGLQILGIELTALTIFGGALGIGIGFGLQKIAANFISGLILLVEKSVEQGDLVELSNGTFGYVRHMGARYLLVESFDGKEIMIPNEDFITTSVTNWTYSNSRARVEITIGVSYKSDIELAMQLILEAARSHPTALQDPEPVCYMREFADSSVNYLLFFWIDDVTAGRYGPQSDVMRDIWRKFAENNIEIPFPQRDVHIKQSENSA
ncbi:MAG: mechanosensitive ion channel [Boseongicola sp.]|nr:mechanosensitive ion channel [Boseongicola sp.]